MCQLFLSNVLEIPWISGKAAAEGKGAHERLFVTGNNGMIIGDKTNDAHGRERVVSAVGPEMMSGRAEQFL